MNNILITSAGQRVSLVRAFQKELKKINTAAKVYTVDFNPLLAPACHVADGFKQLEKVNESTYIDRLLSICMEWDIKLIVPTIDTELLILSKNKQLFLSKGIIIVVSDSALVGICRDKRIMNDFFQEYDVEVPQPIDKDNLRFPLFIKPYDGSLSKDIFLVREESDLQPYFFENPKLMFMEYIDQDTHDEYTVDTYYDQHGDLKCVVPRKRIFVRAGEVNKGVTHKNELVDYIQQRMSHLDGAIGCLTMQFFFNKETKRIIGIEINPRFGGGFPLSYQAGANYPKFLIQEYLLNETIEYTNEWEDNLLMLRYDDEILIRNYEE